MRSPTSLRVFVAVEVPPRHLAPVGELVERLRASGARIAWVSTANVHATLAFLGDIEFDRVGGVSSAVTAACDAASPFALSIGGTGCFPGTSRAKVLWAGLRGDLEALGILRRRVVEALRDEGFAIDEKPFRPHLTIGRVKDGRGPAFEAVLREHLDWPLDGTPFRVDAVTVIRSELLPSGARYTPLARIGLTGRT